MKKTTLLLSLLLSCYLNIYCQFENEVILNDSWTTIRYVAIEDINADSKLDVIVSLASDLYYFPNNGDGTFQDAINIDTDINRPNFIQPGDIDNDGDIDILVAGGNATNHHRVLWLENDGMFNYQYNDLLNNTDGIDDAYQCLLKDIDGDSDLDIVINSYGSQEIYVIKNEDGRGNFGSPISFEAERGLEKIDAIDINLDGHLDIFYVSRFNNSNAFGYFLSNNSNSYEQIEIGGLTGSNANQFEFYDIDKDGDQDLIGQSYNGNQLAFFRNNGAGSFGDREVIWTKNSDWNGGRPVYFYIQEVTGKNQLIFFTDEGNSYSIDIEIAGFPDPVLLFDGEFEFYENELQFMDHGDLNDDGIPDIAFARDFTNPVLIRLAQSQLIDSDNDGFDNNVECNDNDPNINPDQTEVPYNGIDDDCNSATFDDDLDQDGFLLANDCDDNNSSINPNQTEEPYNGIDDDCNSATFDDDLDQDGFLLANDCDDNNSSINPNQTEEPYNGVDDDCNSATFDLSLIHI